MMFWSRSGPTPEDVRFDVHSHLVPDVDDGVDHLDEALEVVGLLHEMGYQGAVTTPHVWEDRFPNSDASLREAFEPLRQAVTRHYPGFRLQLGAEYMLDETVLDRLYDERNEFLTFGSGPQHRFLLVECNTVQEPPFMDEFLDECARQHHRPILAHVERYQYVQMDTQFERLAQWRHRGALLQLNVGSVTGQYGSGIQRLARTLLKAGQIDLLGSDIHSARQARRFLPQAWKVLRRKAGDFDLTWQHRLG